MQVFLSKMPVFGIGKEPVNLIFKLVRQGSVVSVYVYTENCAEDSYMRNNPFTAIENCYTGAGCIGFVAMPTGEGMEGLNMTISSISVKNLDVEKADGLVVGDIEKDYIFEPEDDGGDTPIDDPTLNNSSSNSDTSNNEGNSSGKGRGCFGSISGISLAVALPLIFGALFVSKRKED